MKPTSIPQLLSHLCCKRLLGGPKPKCDAVDGMASDKPCRVATFTVAIDDSYCEWTYAFGLPSSTCIQDVVEAIAEAFGAEVPEGKLTRGYCE